MKLWLDGAAAVCQIVSDGGTRYGNDEIARPRKPRKKSPIVATNGMVSPSRRNDRHAANAVRAVKSGTGHRKKKFGSTNQRSRMRGNASGVQRLTAAMKASTA